MAAEPIHTDEEMTTRERVPQTTGPQISGSGPPGAAALGSGEPGAATSEAGTVGWDVPDRNAAVPPGGQEVERPGPFRRWSAEVRRQSALWRDFRDVVREDYRVNGRDWTKPGFRALFVHRFSGWQKTVHPRLLRYPLWWMYLFLFRWVRNSYGIELYHTTRVGRRMIIAHQNGIVIHPLAEIGDDCILRQNVTVGAVSANRAAQAPRLGNRVEVGCGAAILGGVTIGDDVRIGANVVVMTSIPAGSTVVTPPPRVIQLPADQRARPLREPAS